MIVTDEEQARRVARATFATRLFVVVGLVFLAGSLVTNLVLAASIRDTQLQGTPIGKKLMSASDRILDCTDSGTSGEPPGECYQQGQKRTAKVLADVTRVIVLAASCAVDVTPEQTVGQRQQAITACITTRLAKP